jgi:hypothetical protein
MTLDSKLSKLLAGSALVAASALPQKSEAQIVPYMDVDTNVVTGNYDDDIVNSGLENIFIYGVTNFGDGNNANNPDGFAYNLLSFTVPAGSNQGVFNYTAPPGSWTANIGSDVTTFTGGIIAPNGGDAIFELWADDANPTIVGSATATASGTLVYPDTPFQDYNGGSLSSNQYVDVDVPGVIPEPGNIALLLGAGAGAAALYRRRRNDSVEKSITYEK